MPRSCRSTKKAAVSPRSNESSPDRRAGKYTIPAPFRGTAAESLGGGSRVTVARIYEAPKNPSSRAHRRGVGSDLKAAGRSADVEPSSLRFDPQPGGRSGSWRYRTWGEVHRTRGEGRLSEQQRACVKTLQMLFFFRTRTLPHLGGRGPHLGGRGPHLGGRNTAPGRKNDRTPEAVEPHSGGRIAAPGGKPPTNFSCKSVDFFERFKLPCFCSCFKLSSVLTTGKNFLGGQPKVPESSRGGGVAHG